MSANPETPIALTIAGSDSSAGAGAQADLKTFSAFGVYGLTALTCVVAEMPGKVAKIEALSAEIVRAQLEVLLAGFRIGAVKTGLLHSAAIVRTVAAVLREFTAQTGRALPLVIDPVMVATSGEPLLAEDAITAYEEDLFPLAALVTPNLDEVATLLDCPVADLSMMHAAGAELRAKYGVPFLLKGGHLAGNRAIDLLFTDDGTTAMEAKFSRGIDTHGTGCTYSAAIAAGLAAGEALPSAVRQAKAFVTAAIVEHFAWASATGRAVHALNHSPKEWSR